MFCRVLSCCIYILGWCMALYELVKAPYLHIVLKFEINLTSGIPGLMYSQLSGRLPWLTFLHFTLFFTSKCFHVSLFKLYLPIYSWQWPYPVFLHIHIISLKILEVLLNAYVGLKNNLFRDNCIPQSSTFPYSNFMLVIPIYTGAVDSVWLHSFAGSVACNTNQPWESKTNYSQ